MLAVLFAVSAHGETIPVQIDGSVGKLSAVIQKLSSRTAENAP